MKVRPNVTNENEMKRRCPCLPGFNVGDPAQILIESILITV
jgi:hypothetical protein